MPTTDQPKITRAEAQSVVEKLQALRETLSANEQSVLDTLLRAFEARVVKEPSVQDLLADFPEGSELLEDVAGFASIPEGQEDQLTPTWTTVTVATVAASHPWIGC